MKLQNITLKLTPVALLAALPHGKFMLAPNPLKVHWSSESFSGDQKNCPRIQQ